MSRIWITPDRLFDGDTLQSDLSVRLENGTITEIGNHPDMPNPVRGCLTPGFLDLQVNGGGGVQLNETPTPEAMATIAAAHRKFGTVAILPTVITDHRDILEQAASAALTSKGAQGILGLHIEGPHISVARRGTHSAAYVRPMEPRSLEIVSTLRAAEIPVMITLAPEAVDAADVTALAAMGAIVSIGHTDATAEAVEATVAAGASTATHLFNAMSPMTSRAPGAVGAVLHSGIPFGIICDGHHVDDRMVRLALRAAENPDLAFLVSDAMATVGGPDQFDLYGTPVHLKDGRLVNREGSLAGAHMTQARGVQRLVTDIGLSLEKALRMAITTPARVLGRTDLATLIGRSAADVLLLSETHAVNGVLANHSASLGLVDATE